MRRVLAAALAATLPVAAVAQTATTGSANCTALTQAAAGEIEARIQADDQAINAPQSVTALTCLDNFFNGVGLNVITNLLDPAALLSAIEGQLCAAVSQAWQGALGSAQCGLTISGFNLGFGGLGGGLMCPRLSFGGGGPTIGTFGIGTGASGGQVPTGTALPPTGYTVPPALGGLY